MKNIKELHTASEAGKTLIKTLMRDDAFSKLILHPGEIAKILPEVKLAVGFDQRNPHHLYDVWVHTAHCVAYAAQEPLLRLAMLMHDLGKPETFYLAEDAVGHFNKHEAKGEKIVRHRLPALGFDDDAVDLIAMLVRFHDKKISETALASWIDELGHERLSLLLDVKEADARAHSEKYKNIQLARITRLRGLIKDPFE